MKTAKGAKRSRIAVLGRLTRASGVGPGSSPSFGNATFGTGKENLRKTRHEIRRIGCTYLAALGILGS
jgi:hypothetical protein